MVSQSERIGFEDLEKRTLTRVCTISFLALAVRHWFFKHSSTSDLQCSGITDADAEDTEIVSHSLNDAREDSGVRGGGIEAGEVGSPLSCDRCKVKINIIRWFTKLLYQMHCSVFS